MKFSRSIFALFAVAMALVACDSNYYSDFPKWPSSYVYDTIDCSGWDIPAGAITVREALQIGKALGAGNTSENEYYIKGIVTSFHSKHASAMEEFGNAQFYIQDNLDVAAAFYGYQAYTIGQVPFDYKTYGLSQLQVGDFVVIKSKIQNYNGTIETTNKGSAYLVFSTRDEAYPLVEYTYIKDDFANGLGDWTTQVVSGSVGDIWTITKTVNPAYIIADSKSAECESWLVSPEFHVDETHEHPVQLFFTHGYKYTGSSTAEQAAQYLRAKVRTSDGTWHDMACHCTLSKLGFKTTPDSLDITQYASGNIQVAFAYKSDAIAQPQWKIQSISVRERKRARGTSY